MTALVFCRKERLIQLGSFSLDFSCAAIPLFPDFLPPPAFSIRREGQECKMQSKARAKMKCANVADG